MRNFIASELSSGENQSAGLVSRFYHSSVVKTVGSGTKMTKMAKGVVVSLDFLRQ